MVRRALLTILITLACASPASAAEQPVPPFSNADYWTFADGVMQQLDSWWDPAEGAYVFRGIPSVRVNSALLLTHAVAADAGHSGPTRQDARARVLVHRLTNPPAWLGATASGGRSTCWSRDLDRVKRQHASLEPKVAEALAWAWRARAALGLSTEAAARIQDLVATCARSAAWRHVRVANQINWNAEMYASATAISHRSDLLRGEYRRQLAAFAAEPANFGRGLHFRYDPHRSPGAAINLDTPEYANIVVHALIHYDEALRLGMRPLPRASMRRMRAWVTRLLAGSWTHAGYLNWDTGKGRRRWHSAQYWAFAQQGLLTIATSPRLWADRVQGRWAKALFDRGLELFRRLGDANGGLPPRLMFGVQPRLDNFDCYCARMVANAARAVAFDLGSQPSADPPPLYAFDADTGRLAVTTPRYSTAIVPDNRRVFSYGGLDPARLFGPGQTVAANIGGVPPAAFGLVVASRRGRELVASQHTRRGRLRLVRAPRRGPFGLRAGPFRVLETRGTVTRGGLRLRASHRFRSSSIESRWRVRCAGRCRYDVQAHFPTWGARSVIDAERRDGTRVRLEPGTRIRLADVGALEVGRGYRVVPLAAPRGATLVAVPVERQPSNPRPGPSLRVELVRRGAFHERALAVRIEPTRG